MNSLPLITNDQYDQLCADFRSTIPFVARTFFRGLLDIQPSDNNDVELSLPLANIGFSLLAGDRNLEEELAMAIQKLARADGYFLLVEVASVPIQQKGSLPMLDITAKAYVNSNCTASSVVEKPLLYSV